MFFNNKNEIEIEDIKTKYWALFKEIELIKEYLDIAFIELPQKEKHTIVVKKDSKEYKEYMDHYMKTGISIFLGPNK